MKKDLTFSDFLLQFLSTEEWRRPKVLLNNLIGRRTVSNLFWGAQYGLLPFFNLFSKLSADDFELALKRLHKRGLIESQQDGKVLLTKTGKQEQKSVIDYISQFHFRGIGLHTNLNNIQQCLNLVIQITSEFSCQNNRYYPLQYSGQTMARAKQWFVKNKSIELPRKLHAELTDFLLTIPADEANAFTNSMIGHDDFGLTDQQIETALNVTPFNWKLRSLSLVAAFVKWASADSDTHFLCQQIVSPWLTTSALSTSSALSYQLYLKNTNLQAVANCRRVKLNTIKEHLLEAAILTPSFPFQLILPNKFSSDLETYLGARTINQWQFDEVSKLDSQFSFFEFRLLQIERGHIQYAN